MYDRKVCLRFGSERRDVLLTDNTSMMHTRSAFVGNYEGELWGIHVN